MEFKLITRSNIAELVVTSGNARISEDVATAPGCLILDSDIEKVITLGFDMSRFNRNKDLDLVKSIVEAFLNDSERADLIEYLNPKV